MTTDEAPPVETRGVPATAASPTGAGGAGASRRRPDLPVPRRARSWWEPAPFGPGQLLGAIGGVAVLVSCFLVWISGGIGFGADTQARHIPIEFLWDRSPGSTDPSLLVALIPIGVVSLVGALWSTAAGLRFLAGVCALVVVGAFVFQLARLVDDLGTRAGGVGDHLGVGWYVCTIGGVLVLISAFVPTPWARRVEEVPPAA